jgi:hypothetical protein
MRLANLHDLAGARLGFDMDDCRSLPGSEFRHLRFLSFCQLFEIGLTYLPFHIRMDSRHFCF